MSHGFHIQPDEQVLIKLRKHWFILFQETIGTVLVGVCALFLAVFALNLGVLPESVVSAEAVVLLGALWLLLIWLGLAVIWTNYYLDVWIVTDRRIVNIEQVGLFNRRIVTWRMERVQDVTTEIGSFIQTMFNFGSIQVETAGPTAEIAMIRGIPDPERVKQTILNQVDMYTEEHLRVTRPMGQSTHDVHAE
jgi:membrane protein YdbS with pleckstrin-like domain